MEVTVRAVYRDGVLKPQEELYLPENTPVQIHITPLPTPEPRTSLFGVFPELTALTHEDFVAGKHLWHASTDRQSRIIDGTE